MLLFLHIHLNIKRLERIHPLPTTTADVIEEIASTAIAFRELSITASVAAPVLDFNVPTHGSTVDWLALAGTGPPLAMLACTAATAMVSQELDFAGTSGLPTLDVPTHRSTVDWLALARTGPPLAMLACTAATAMVSQELNFAGTSGLPILDVPTHRSTVDWLALASTGPPLDEVRYIILYLFTVYD
jgi:hypothetical protein